jgi:hypothetical protein
LGRALSFGALIEPFGKPESFGLLNEPLGISKLLGLLMEPLGISVLLGLLMEPLRISLSLALLIEPFGRSLKRRLAVNLFGTSEFNGFFMATSFGDTAGLVNDFFPEFSACAAASFFMTDILGESEVVFLPTFFFFVLIPGSSLLDPVFPAIDPFLVGFFDKLECLF